MWQANIVDISKQTGTYGSAGGVTEPVTLADAKDQCRVNFTDDDTIITSLITQARHFIENYCHVSIVPKVITLTLEMAYVPRQPTVTKYQAYQIMKPIELPEGPVSSIQGITNIQATGQIQSLVQDTDYFLTGTLFKSIRFVNPGINIILVYQAGYATCPEDLRLAILQEIAYRYDNRGDDDKLKGMSSTAIPLADPYRRLFWQ